jgi:MOSC domain-containing protein YiiM
VSQFAFETEVEIVRLVASPLHRYEGRPADGPRSPVGPEQPESITVRDGLGIVGDRYFGHSAHVSASVTIMAIESLEFVERTLALTSPLDPADTRRNIIVRGMPIDSLRGETFALDTGQGEVLFRANRPANPCAWMDVALAPGAHRALARRGGMRCTPLTDGTLALGPARLLTSVPVATPALF